MGESVSVGSKENETPPPASFTQPLSVSASPRQTSLQNVEVEEEEEQKVGNKRELVTPGETLPAKGPTPGEAPPACGPTSQVVRPLEEPTSRMAPTTKKLTL